MPNDPVLFLSLDEVLAIHERVIDRFGGAVGVRDVGLLESALYRPQTGYYRDLAEMAAALFESLLMNHPFLDGNKRTGHAAMEVFVLLNGLELDAPVDEQERVMLGLAAGELSRDAFVDWLRSRSRAIT